MEQDLGFDICQSSLCHLHKARTFGEQITKTFETPLEVFSHCDTVTKRKETLLKI